MPHSHGDVARLDGAAGGPQLPDACPDTCLHTYPDKYPSIHARHMSTHMSIHTSAHMSKHVSIHLSGHMSKAQVGLGLRLAKYLLRTADERDDVAERELLLQQFCRPRADLFFFAHVGAWRAANRHRG